MCHLPRIAVGTIDPRADIQPLSWALMDVLSLLGPHVQAFCSQSRFPLCDGAGPITGQCHRHLDSWLMSPDVCREIFYHGTRSCDVAIVEGKYLSALDPAAPGGNLDALCDWLDLPRLVVLDATTLGDCRFPRRPEQVDGVLLDRVGNPGHAAILRNTVEALWGVPVLGMLPELPAVRSVIAGLAKGKRPSRELCRLLGERLAPTIDMTRLLAIAEARDFPVVPDSLFRAASDAPELNVAVAYDDAFHCYFCDTLDLLELRGATIRDFSPLRGDSLPPDTDLVLLGCGHIEHEAEALAANYCIKQALHAHVDRGGRVYAEGSGLAYLCQEVALPGNRNFPMIGVLPAVARLNPNPLPPEPVELTLANDTWLAAENSRLRGYLNTNWLIEPLAPLASFSAEPERALDLLGCKQALGSRLHLNFAAQPALLPSFFRPRVGGRQTVS